MVKKLGDAPRLPSPEEFHVYREIKERLAKLTEYAQRDPFLKDDFFARIIRDHERPEVASLWDDLLRLSETLRTLRAPHLWDNFGIRIDLPDFRHDEIRLDNVTRFLWSWQPSFEDPAALLARFRDVQAHSEEEPVRLEASLGGGSGKWLFKGMLYEANGPYSDDEKKLLILEEFDKERGCCQVVGSVAYDGVMKKEKTL